ncbi:Autophagy-related protein 13 [Lasiodiplodia theobromae]|uniref:Autophagy-related protein 13 n=1 Tax=Lasiodiplodia theobromae TaxID=45133 RepID=A0A5N5CXI4_9PEZI|nr:Autophagy-related protein 13 [Lasiodiplodia theobromae]KAB2570080.1 Autophagy-related protein 13 [Lasiodiplodia theobromae]KAF4543259.1 Autophagy-related protein 13 [Lasiodiplodia theobromae]KAF9636411.1 Autophagy-related protein 13 [Lasiodiplodia theobromae]
MHQHPRPSPRAASSANSPRSNPTRTNNPRDMAHIRSESASTVATARSDTGSDYIEKASDGGEPDFYGETEEERTQKKLNQVIMQFFKKATLTVLSARTQLPQAFSAKGELRQSKWFSLLLDETDVYNDDLRDWTSTDLVNAQPPPLCIEIYLDTKDLADGEALAIVDEHGKLWDVTEALTGSTPVTTRPSSRSGRPTQVVLERWNVEVTDNQKMDPDASRMLPLVYKNGIPLFRSLYTYTRFLPAWRYYRQIAKQPVNHPALPLRYRISNGMFKSPRRDTLDLPLYPGADSKAQTHQFDSVKSPIGLLSIQVQYRSNTEFRVEKSESVLSSHFMGMDDYSFSPSYPERVPGSLPTGRNAQLDRQARGEAYGSLSTFHQAGATGTSPMSALRNAKDMGSPESPPQKIPPNHRIATGSKSSLRGADASSPASPRRTSVSFQPANPFKAGSLSSSPVPGVYSPTTSSGRPGSGPAPPGHTRNRSSLNALPQAALRTPSGHSLPNETAIASSASSSPKPAPISRYSSSFSNRRQRFSYGGTSSKVEDDNNSSGKGSTSSSAQRLEGGSSGSVQTDEENISDFLKLLEQKKDLKSLNRTDSASRDASMRRTTAALSKYQRMRESNAALSDSISSSLHLHRSSSSSSRQISNVPGMIAGASVSTSSSPGKPISPHTPHTPAIPSRLSANSIIDYSEQTRSRSPRVRRLEEETGTGDAGSDSTTREREGSNAIDIPTSPRPWPFARRSSSVSQQNRNTLEDEGEMFGLRSASLPTDDRPDLSLSELLHAAEPATPGDAAPAGGDESGPDPEPSPQTVLTSHTRTRSAGAARTTTPSLAYRTRIQQSGPSDGRRSAASERGESDSGLVSGRSSRAGSRFSFSSRPLSVAANLDDDEPLLFTMSELGTHQAGRRSVDEVRDSTGKRRGGSPWRGA